MRHKRRGRASLLIMTIIAIGLTILGFMETLRRHAGVGLLAIVIGSMVYTLAWTIAVLDSLQAHRTGWSLALVLMLPLGIGPLLYSIIGLATTSEHEASGPIGSIDVP